MNINNIKKFPTELSPPKISIGIPVYNGEKYISLAIESVLKQTFKDVEIIISDNASTDNTEKICREYKAKDGRIQYLRQTTNNGGINNFKVVLDNSIGKYFIWLAADDILGNKDYLKILNDEISEKYDYYFSDVSIINNKGKVIKSNTMSSFKKCKNQADFLKVSLTENSMQLYSLFLKVNLVTDWKYMETCKKWKHCNEGLFVHAICAKRKGKFVNKAIKFYRNHKDNWSSNVTIKNLVVSQVMYTLKSIHLMITLKNLTFTKKFIFSIKKFYLTLKALSYFVLYALGRSLGLDKILYLKKIIKKIRK